MTTTMGLMKRGDRTLILVKHEAHEGGTPPLMPVEYVVGSYYDPSYPYGEQWCWGHYFGNDLLAAVEFILERKTPIDEPEPLAKCIWTDEDIEDLLSFHDVEPNILNVEKVKERVDWDEVERTMTIESEELVNKVIYKLFPEEDYNV